MNEPQLQGLLRRGDTWRIRQRRVTIHYFNPLPGARMGAPQAE